MTSEISPVRRTSVRSRLEYLFAITVLVIAAALLILGGYNFVQAQHRKVIQQQQLQQVKELTNQVKTLAEENRQLNLTANNYAYCNAQILAKYTQTQQPISIDDLNACILSSFPNGKTAPTNAAPNSSQPPVSNNQSQTNSNVQSSQSSSSSSSSIQPATPSPSQTQPSSTPAPVNPQPTAPPSVLTTPLLPCVNFLGIVKTC